MSFVAKVMSTSEAEGASKGATSGVGNEVGSKGAGVSVVTKGTWGRPSSKTGISWERVGGSGTATVDGGPKDSWWGKRWGHPSGGEGMWSGRVVVAGSVSGMLET